MDKIGEVLLRTVPKLKTQIQLIGFAITVVTVFLIQFIKPGNVAAQVVGALVGVTVLVFPFAFQMIDRIPPQQRAPFISNLFIVFVVSCVLLSMVVAVLLYLDSADRQLVRTHDKSVEVQKHKIVTELGRRRQELKELENSESKTVDLSQRRVIFDEIGFKSRQVETLVELQKDVEIDPDAIPINLSGNNASTPALPDDLRLKFASALSGGSSVKIVIDSLNQFKGAIRGLLSDIDFQVAWLDEISGQTDEAIARLEESLKVNGGNTRARIALARLLLVKGELQGALKQCESAYNDLKIDRKNDVEFVLAGHQYAVLLRVAGRNAEAVELLSQLANKIDVRNTEGRIIKAHVISDWALSIMYLGQFDVASNLSDQAVNLINKESEVGEAFRAFEIYSVSGLISAYYGNTKVALERHEKSVKMTDGKPEVDYEHAIYLVNAAIANGRLGRIPAATKEITEAVALLRGIVAPSNNELARAEIVRAEIAVYGDGKGGSDALVSAINIAEPLRDNFLQEYQNIVYKGLEIAALNLDQQILDRYIDDVNKIASSDSVEHRTHFLNLLVKGIIALRHRDIDGSIVLFEELYEDQKSWSFQGGFFEARSLEWLCAAAKLRDDVTGKRPIWEKRLQETRDVKSGELVQVGAKVEAAVQWLKSI